MSQGVASAVGCDASVPSQPGYVVDIVGVSKSFTRRSRARKGYTTLKASLLSLFRRGLRQKSSSQEDLHYGVKNLTLRIPRGASVGVIGRNGSGKSTFLKLVTGIYKPTSGVLNVKGKVAALIELGAGFHPDFTGRENLYLSGLIQGLSREEIRERFDEIVRFAELEDVIDDPVRTYSSGMFMRLGFSIAIHTDPDILLVDEVLAVGDAGFVAKCKERIAEFRRAGKTLVLVTHDLDAVARWCDEVIWINDGEVVDRGNPRRVIDAYLHFIETREEARILEDEVDTHSKGAASCEGSPEGGGQEPARWGSREVELTRITMAGDEGVEKRVFHPDEGATISFSYRVNEAVNDLVFGVGITRADGVAVYGTNTEIDRVKLPALGQSGTVSFRIDRVGLLEGNYALDVAAHRVDGYALDFFKGALHFSVRSEKREVGIAAIAHRWLVNGEVLG